MIGFRNTEICKWKWQLGKVRHSKSYLICNFFFLNLYQTHYLKWYTESLKGSKGSYVSVSESWARCFQEKVKWRIQLIVILSRLRVLFPGLKPGTLMVGPCILSPLWFLSSSDTRHATKATFAPEVTTFSGIHYYFNPLLTATFKPEPFRIRAFSFKTSAGVCE